MSGGPLGHPTCEEALLGWFARVDKNHNGAIDLDAFLADARRQFAAMDLDHDGVITPAVLAEYRAKYESEPQVAEAAPTDDDAENTEQGARQKGGGRGGRRGGENGSGRGGGSGAGGLSQDRPDPVMLADIDLSNKVTLAKFLAYERQNFAEFDTNHDGRLSKGEITRLCPKT